VRNELSRTSLTILCFACALLAAACESLSSETGVATSALSGPRWVAQSIDGAPVEGGRLYIQFNAADRLAGSGGCNALTAIYEVGEAAIAVRALDVGERSCEAELMRQEARFVDVLAGAARYERADGRLIIADAQGRRMVFAAGV